jgi:hypothetical protein
MNPYGSLFVYSTDTFSEHYFQKRAFVYSDVVLFVFVLCLVYPMLQVSLNYPFLIAPSVFSYVYL